MKPVTFSTIVTTLVALAACGGRPAADRPAGRDAAPAAVRGVDVPSGTVVSVRLVRALSTARNRAGDSFDAVLDEPVAVDGAEILPRGVKFTGHVTTAEPSGRLKGRGVLGLTLDAFELAGQRYSIDTSLDTRTTAAHKARNIEIIGGGAGVGALIGAIAGGGKGAGVGAAIGAAGGTGVAASTGKKEVEVPAETVFRFTLRQPVTLPRP